MSVGNKNSHRSFSFSTIGRGKTAISFLALAALGCGSAHAAAPDDQQAAETVGTSDQISDIVVTAQRREQRLQDVPIATTVLTGAALQSSGITQSNQIAFQTPNLQISGSADNLPKVVLRGIGSNDFVPNASAAVGTYVDDVYVGLATGQTFQIFDLERVEVLRGPQGTLYGKNTTGGAIKYVTAQPKIGSFGGDVNVGIGRFRLFEVGGAINLPISDTLAARVSFVSRDRDGFIANTFKNRDQRQLNSWAGRAQLFYEPSDRVNMLLKVFGGKSRGDAGIRKAVGLLPALGGTDILGYKAPSDPYVTETDLDTFDRVADFGLAFTANIKFDWATLTTITAYQSNQRQIDDDVDNSPNALTHNFFGNDSNFVSQEVKLSGEAGKLNWTVGGHLYREKIDVSFDLRFFECTLLPTPCALNPNGIAPLPPGYLGTGRFPPAPGFVALGIVGLPIATRVLYPYSQTNNSRAAFADATYKIAEGLSLTAGIRYTSETRSFSGASRVFPIAAPSVAGGLFPGFPQGFEAERTWENITWRGVLDYKPNNDTLFYASVARGFRSGNFNGASFARLSQVQDPVNPETLTNYEVGAKLELFDRRMRFNTAIFYTDYNDLQVSVFQSSQQFLRNASGARIYGAETELTVVPTKGLTARVALGYLNAKYQNFIYNAAPLIDLSGNRLVNAPELTSTVTVDYRKAVSDRIELNVGGDWRYQSQVYFTPFNVSNLSEDAYSVFNARLGITEIERNVSLQLLVQNVFNKAYRTDGNSIGAPFGYDIANFSMPRTWGLNLSARF